MDLLIAVVTAHLAESKVYHLLEYCVDDRLHILSFDRGYVYCGDISEEAYRWLIESCKIRQYLEGDQVFNSWADELGETSPHKDYFRMFHPIASKHKAIRAYWLEEVKDIHKHRSRIKPPRLQEISKLKIRRPE